MSRWVAIMVVLAAVHQPVAARPPADELLSEGADGVSCGADPRATTISEGGSVTFRGLVLGSKSRRIFSWMFPGGQPTSAGDTLNPPSVSYSVAGEYRARLTVRDEDNGQVFFSADSIVTV